VRRLRVRLQRCSGLGGQLGGGRRRARQRGISTRRARIFFSISTDSIKTYVKFVGQECSIESTAIVSVDGNVVTAEDGETDETETRLEVMGNTLTVTPLGSAAELEEVTAESVDGDPADILNCSSSSSSGIARQHALGRGLWPRECVGQGIGAR